MTRYRRLGAAALMVSMLAWAGSAVHAAGRTHEMGRQGTGTVQISDLQGNITSGSHIHISGTGVSVHVLVKGSYSNTYHRCTVYLGSEVLATGKQHVRADPGYSEDHSYFVTDSAGRWEGTVMFDTTGLPTGAGGESGTYLKLKVLPTQGVPPESGDPTAKGAGVSSNTIPYVQVYNMAYVISNCTADEGYYVGMSAHAACESMNHSASPDDIYTTNHVKSTMLQYLPSYTLFIHVSHGAWDESPYEDKTIFFDCTFDPDDPQNNDVGAHGMPSSEVPDKSSIQPHYNMVLTAACYSAGDPQDIPTVYHKDMAQAFGICRWIDGSARANRAYFGWVGVNISWDNPFFTALVEELANGRTILRAAQLAHDEYPAVQEYKVYGDENATLHGVYSGVLSSGQ